jgi:hypothetical protein
MMANPPKKKPTYKPPARPPHLRLKKTATKAKKAKKAKK